MQTNLTTRTGTETNFFSLRRQIITESFEPRRLEPKGYGAISLPGEHLFQASRIAPNRMRPIIFHAFGKAKLDAPAQLARLARHGWETLPIAILGMPHYPAWSLEAWRPIGGCCFTGGASALTGNSAFRFCLLMQWHAIAVPATALFQDARKEEDTDLESARTVSETDQDFLERSLLAAATDQNSRESGSSLPEGLMTEKQAGLRKQPSSQPSAADYPAPFAPWPEIAKQLDGLHELAMLMSHTLTPVSAGKNQNMVAQPPVSQNSSGPGSLQAAACTSPSTTCHLSERTVVEAVVTLACAHPCVSAFFVTQRQ